jgi:HEAT repeat protein
MKIIAFAAAVSALCVGACVGLRAAQVPTPKDDAAIKKAEAEVEARYSAAHPEIKEYVLWTARTFGPSRFWLPEDTFADLSAATREKRIQHLATLFNEAEYGRHLCAALGEASALKDQRLVPGLMKVAGYQLEGRDYDCRAKWMAVAALARQESEDAVPLLISLVDHGNQNTRNWARAALARKTSQDLQKDKQAWAKWWVEQGHSTIDEKFLKPTPPPPQNGK